MASIIDAAARRRMLTIVLLNATERKVLLMCGVVGGFLCAAPGELVSSGVLWGLSLAGYFVHRWLLGREQAKHALTSADVG